MKNNQPALAVATSETQTIVMSWVRATEEFHQHYFRLNELINRMQRNQCLSLIGPAGSSQTNLRALMNLRTYMSDVLMTLLVDMTKPKAGYRSGSAGSSSKPGQIASHARLIQDINRKVGREMKRLAPPQA